MKDTILSVIIFGLALVIVTVLCAGSFILFVLGSRLFLFPSISLDLILPLVPPALTQMFLPATLITLFVTMIRVRRRPGVLFLSYILVGALAFTVLFLGPQLIESSISSEIRRIQVDTALSLRDLEHPQKLIALKEAWLFFEKKSGATLESGMLIRTEGRTMHARPFRQATYETGENGTGLSLEGASRVTLAPRAEETAAFAPGATAGTIIDSFSALNAYFLSTSDERKTEFTAICVLLAAFVLSSSFFLRMTKWPLANIFLALLILFVILAFYNFLISTVIGELEKILGKSDLLAFIPHGMLAFFSGLFFIFDFILLPEKRRRSIDA